MKRPFAVTTLLFAVLCLTSWNAIRLYAAISDWDSLAEFAPHPGPIYIATTASFWTLSGLALFNFLRRPSARARRFAAIYVFGYTAWAWTNRLLLQEARPNWPFALIATLVFLALFSALLFEKNLGNYFQQRENNDQQNKDSNPA
ncbi:MAG: hypothetical protein HY867_12210 [Chloroflexi bacterium]|nr:hypothetical protein [Chloroflexota bacterium]